MRHKTFQLSPKFLSHHSIPYRKIVHREGEFMITFPYAYHAGFNLGYNCAESTNFAIERWIEIGRQAKSCECVNYSVRIDVDALLGLNASEQKRKRERTAKKEIIKQCLICGREDLSDTMLPVEAREKFIHRHCALWIPELSIERDGEAGEEEVVGLESIPRARWKLECKYCSYQKGACIQCYSNRCFRSFHPSCAIEEQLCMQTRPMEQDGHRSILYECFCPQHDPRKSLVKLTKQQMHAAEIMRAIDDTSASPIIVWARWSDGYFYSGRLQQDFRDRSMCRIIFIDVCCLTLTKCFTYFVGLCKIN
jgi:hypothetical protein